MASGVINREDVAALVVKTLGSTKVGWCGGDM